MINYKEYLSVAIQAAVLAGKEIREVYQRDITVELKDDKSPLTEADKRANNVIVEKLKETDLPILSEEGKTINFSDRSSWKLFWLVDPLDGTKEFIKRNGEFTVNIALINGNTPVGGVIYAPELDVFYFGCDEIGSYKLDADFEHLQHLILNSNLLDQFILKSTKLPMNDVARDYTVVASRSHMSEETLTFVESLKSIHGKVDLISKGSSLKLCLVAEGKADIYPRFAPTMEWDTAAGQAIAQGAGFKVIDANTKSNLTYNKENLLNPWFIVG